MKNERQKFNSSLSFVCAAAVSRDKTAGSGFVEPVRSTRRDDGHYTHFVIEPQSRPIAHDFYDTVSPHVAHLRYRYAVMAALRESVLGFV